MWFVRQILRLLRRRAVRSCSLCGRAIEAGAVRCMYCGAWFE